MGACPSGNPRPATSTTRTSRSSHPRPGPRAYPASGTRCSTGSRRPERSGRPGRCAGSTRRTASTARRARGPTRRDRDTSPSSARTAPRPSRGRPTASASTASSSPTHAVADLAERSDYWLGQQGRLTEPVLQPAGSDHYEPITWDDAFDVVARELHGTRLARTRRSSTPPAARATRRRSSTSSSSARSAPTTCPTARTCATSRRASPSQRPSASARAR